MALTSGFPGSIHGDLDGSVVGGHLGRVGEDGDCERETLPWGDQGRSLMPDTFTVPQLPICAVLPEPLSFSPLQTHRESRRNGAQAAGLGIQGPRRCGPGCPPVRRPLGHSPLRDYVFMIFFLIRDPDAFEVKITDECVLFPESN